jgi:hypothetical protein
MKKILHINMHSIRSNNAAKLHRTRAQSEPDLKPVITVKDHKSNTYAYQVSLRLRDGGTEVLKLVYQPYKPLSCGAQVWIETNTDVIDVVPLDLEGREIPLGLGHEHDARYFEAADNSGFDRQNDFAVFEGAPAVCALEAV